MVAFRTCRYVVVVSTLLLCAWTSGVMALSVAAASSVPTVTYFDARGRAELTRCIFRLGSKEFVDHRFPIAFKTDDEGKPAGGFEVKEYEVEKLKGTFLVNMDRLPVLELNGCMIGQSAAMERAAARYCGMMGATDTDQAVIDCIVENVRDVKDSWRSITLKYGFPPSPEKTDAKKEWFTKPAVTKEPGPGGFRQLMTRLNASLPSSPPESIQFAVGESITLADVVIWNLLKETFTEPDDIAMMEEAMTADETSVERLVAIADHIQNTPAMKEWLKVRPESMF
eukprot:scaffold88651_cov68-Attheya_sp.AAC.1